MLADDAAEALDVDQASPGVGTRAGLEVGAGAEGAEAVGLFVGAMTELALPAVGRGVGARVSTVCVTESTERLSTPTASLAAASNELDERDEYTSFEYSSDEGKLVVESDAATHTETAQV